MTEAAQRITDQLKSSADQKRVSTKLLDQVTRYWPRATATYRCEAIRDELLARGVTEVGQVDYVAMWMLARRHRR